MRLSPLAGILVLSVLAFDSDAESDPASAALRLEVRPPEAEVYVDSYLAGTVEKFDVSSSACISPRARTRWSSTSTDTERSGRSFT
jgi:hypothetical protein